MLFGHLGNVTVANHIHTVAGPLSQRIPRSRSCLLLALKRALDSQALDFQGIALKLFPAASKLCGYKMRTLLAL